MVIILLVLGLAQAASLWQLSSDVNTAVFPAVGVAPSRVANTQCEDNAQDYTVAIWAWHDRVLSQKQFFWSLDAS